MLGNTNRGWGALEWARASHWKCSNLSKVKTKPSVSCTKDVIERYKVHTNGVEKSDKPSVELQLENENHIGLSNELEEKSHQLRQ
ncbi:hypothetical protein ACE6H2_005277 [Prunus campanulata]